MPELQPSNPDSTYGLLLAREGAVPSRGRRWHQNGLQDGRDGGTGGALSLGAALGLL
eukprot:COSAG01_NODE_15211_length_1361_cov_1.740095_2_plen_56_part_01